MNSKMFLLNRVSKFFGSVGECLRALPTGQILFLIVLVLIPAFTIAQEENRTTWEIYVERGIDDSSTDRLQFINLLTGEINTLEVTGERYTVLGNSLLYFDSLNRMVMTAHPDSTTIPHPFIQLGAARRVDWIVSSDERSIAWTLTYDNDGGLTTVTTVANPNGTNQNLVLSDGPRNDGVRVFPLAFTLENSGLILDSQPDGIGDIAPYRQYANLFQLSLIDGSITPLSDELACFCAASLDAGKLMRLAITNDFSGFDVALTDFPGGDTQLISSPGLVNYTQGGNILISPDGTRAVYVLSQVEINSTELNVRTVMMLVNLETLTQTQLSQPITNYLQPLGWTEDNTAVLVSILGRNGTWKIDLFSGELRRIATNTYIGLIEF